MYPSRQPGCVVGLRVGMQAVVFPTELIHEDFPLPEHAGSRHAKAYRGILLIRNRTPPRTTIGPYAYAYCRVLEVEFSYERGNPVAVANPDLSHDYRVVGWGVTGPHLEPLV